MKANGRKPSPTAEVSRSTLKEAAMKDSGSRDGLKAKGKMTYALPGTLDGLFLVFCLLTPLFFFFIGFW